MNEVWRDIPGYEGKYQVSNLGNVRSLNWRNTGMTKNLWLKPHNQGYKQVELTDGQKRKTFTVHRLVALCFLPNPLNCQYVNHLDEDKTNNRADNLEWCSQSENARYSYKPQKHKSYRRVQNVLQMTMTGELVKRWDNPTQVKKETGWSDWSISECCRGHRKQAYGYVWQYAS